MITTPPTFSPIDLTELARKTLLERHLLPAIPQQVQQEVDAIESPAKPDLSSVKDLRDKLWLSIDNEDTKDLDQITYAEVISTTQTKLFIAIADVDCLVKKGSMIDEYAQQNTTSIYTPSKVFPMLPEKLSTNFSSLLENQDRLAIVIEASIASDGAIAQYQVYSAYVRNKARLNYWQVATWLDKQGASSIPLDHVEGLDKQIRLHDQIARQLQEYRHQQGSLVLDLAESRPIVRKDSMIQMSFDERNRARELIENCMITANTIAAYCLRDGNRPIFCRIVRVPARWDRIVAIARQYGEHLPDDPDVKSLDFFLLKRRLEDPLHFSDLSLTIVKLLGKGEYVIRYPNEIEKEHFSLGIKDYARSTAPNRRYPDLINQRLIKSILLKESLPYTTSELEWLAKHCTRKEDEVEKVQRKMRKAATIIFLAPQLNEVFDGIVTGAGPKGTWVRISHPFIEGKLIQGFEELDVGDPVKVRLVHLDIEKGFIDFVRVI